MKQYAAAALRVIIISVIAILLTPVFTEALRTEPACGQYLRWMEADAALARNQADFFHISLYVAAQNDDAQRWRVNYTKYLMCKEGMTSR